MSEGNADTPTDADTILTMQRMMGIAVDAIDFAEDDIDAEVASALAVAIAVATEDAVDGIIDTDAPENNG